MSKTNLPNIDLNLLVVLDKIFIEGNLTMAGKKLFLTQSAISHALSKLREHFGDQLFIRQSNKMEPTPLCKNLHKNITPHLKSILQSLDDRGEFDPSTSKRCFCLGLSDYLCKLMLPQILKQVSEQAPDVSIRIIQTTYEQRLEMLKNGKLDISMGCFLEEETGIKKQTLFVDREVCIVRKDHPIKGEVMTEEELSHSEFIALSFSESGLGFLEDFLYRRGVQRKIKVVVQQEIIIPSLVEDSNLVGTLAERLARMYAKNEKFRIINLPLQKTSFEVFQYWNSLNDNDNAHIWMRKIIKKAAETLPDK